MARRGVETPDDLPGFDNDLDNEEVGERRQPTNHRESPMNITTDSQWNPCATNGVPEPVPQDMRSRPLPPTPESADGKPMLDFTMERNTEHAFLRLLIAHDTSKESQQLQHNLAQTKRDEKCICRAVFVMVILSILSLAGVSYGAILLPEVLWKSNYHVLQSLCYLGLGSLISLVVFLGYLLGNRAVVSRLHGECRLRVLAVAKSQFKGGTIPTRAVGLSGASPGGSEVDLPGRPECHRMDQSAKEQSAAMNDRLWCDSI